VTRARRMRALCAVIGATLGFALLVAACAAAPPPDAAPWWAHIQVLADDSLRGRATGTDDYRRAARYVAQQLHALGVLPAGTDPHAAGEQAYFQRVPFTWRRIREPECSLALVSDTAVTPLALGRDANLTFAAADPSDSIEAGLVFVGYGLHVPEAGWDELKGLDLRGKIAVYVRGGPDTLPPALRAHAQASDVRWAGLRAAGAIGAASVSAPTPQSEFGWDRMALGRFQPQLTLDDPVLEGLHGMHVSFRINPAHLDRFFAGSGHTPEEIYTLARAAKPLPAFALQPRVRARIRWDERHVDSPNVVGIVRGSDPKLRDEYVVVSAHLDHLGVGTPVNGDSIYNGAMDNASGVASLLEFARFAKADPSPFRRSVVLLAVTGEEEGLYGSQWYASRPTVPARAIPADINLDMFLPIVPLKAITTYGLHESELGGWFRDAAGKVGVTVVDDPEPQRNYFIRSDQYSFIRQGVPSLFFEFGNVAGDTTTAGILARWNRRHYHRPSDDLDQPVDFAAAASFNRLLYDFTREVANRDARPQWAEDSFFRRFAPAPTAAAPASHSSGTASPAIRRSGAGTH